MNAKLAKALHRAAHNAEKRSNLKPVTYVELSDRRRYAEVPTVSRTGELTELKPKRVQVALGQVVVAPRSGRGVYKRLKQATRRTAP